MDKIHQSPRRARSASAEPEDMEIDSENHNHLSRVINAVDGLNHSDSDHTSSVSLPHSIEENHFADLPRALIATGLPTAVFDEPSVKSQFEELYRRFEREAEFLYLKSFRRVRINYSHGEIAARARIELDTCEISGKTFNTYFVQPVYTEKAGDSPHLQLPALEKQFLISPPASPPVGWEQTHEAQPIIDLHLLAAVAALAPGEEHEIYSPSETVPGIVVSTCGNDDADDHDHASTGSDNDRHRPKIPQTRCPDRNP